MRACISSGQSRKYSISRFLFKHRLPCVTLTISSDPDDENVNPRDDNQNNDVPFTYEDANEAIDQPGLMPFAMIGLTLNL